MYQKMGRALGWVDLVAWDGWMSMMTRRRNRDLESVNTAFLVCSCIILRANIV